MSKRPKRLQIVALIITVVSVISAATIYVAKTTAPVMEQPKREAAKEEISEETQPEETGQAPEIETSDWETYRNDEYGFKIKYPKKWMLESHGLYIRLFPEERRDERRDRPFVSININLNPGKLGIREFYDGVNERDLFSQSNNEYTTGEIAGRVYYKFVPYVTYAGETIVIVVLDSAFLEIVDFGQAFQENRIFDTICSSLEFL